jgi:hypothetical protein
MRGCRNCLSILKDIVLSVHAEVKGDFFSDGWIEKDPVCKFPRLLHPGCI